MFALVGINFLSVLCRNIINSKINYRLVVALLNISSEADHLVTLVSDITRLFMECVAKCGKRLGECIRFCFWSSIISPTATAVSLKHTVVSR